MNKNGFSVLVLVIIIGASALIMTKGAAWFSLRGLDMSLDSDQGSKAKYVAEACINDALLRLQADNNFSTSSQSININDCECTYSVISDTFDRIINSSGACENFNIDLKTTANIQNGLTISKWEYN
ncbi:hypothetical protein C0583_04950 [Candidatus Parcubacteria bacterium]|nr:MAG: hypothetical protein C0583_04950 [Candidatus Parcubacteria bacterium]